MAVDSGSAAPGARPGRATFAAADGPDSTLELHLHHPMPRAAGPPTGRSPSRALRIPCDGKKRPEPSLNLSGSARAFSFPSEGAAAGTRTVPTPRDGRAAAMCGGPTNSDRENFSAGVRPGDNPRAAGASSGSAAQAAAARCEEARRSCCRYPAASLARAASDPAQGTPDSNTAPSNREDIASTRLAKYSGEMLNAP